MPSVKLPLYLQICSPDLYWPILRLSFLKIPTKNDDLQKGSSAAEEKSEHQSSCSAVTSDCKFKCNKYLRVVTSCRLVIIYKILLGVVIVNYVLQKSKDYTNTYNMKLDH